MSGTDQQLAQKLTEMVAIYICMYLHILTQLHLVATGIIAIEKTFKIIVYFIQNCYLMLSAGFQIFTLNMLFKIFKKIYYMVYPFCIIEACTYVAALHSLCLLLCLQSAYRKPDYMYCDLHQKSNFQTNFLCRSSHIRSYIQLNSTYQEFILYRESI